MPGKFQVAKGHVEEVDGGLSSRFAHEVSYARGNCRIGLTRTRKSCNRRVMGFFVKRMPAPLMNLYRRTITKFGKSRRGTGMDPALRRQLTGQFQSEIARLSTLLDRDLAHWSRGSE